MELMDIVYELVMMITAIITVIIQILKYKKDG